MAKQKGNIENTQLESIEVSEMQIEILAKRLLPEIKHFFADANIRLEFEEWQKKRQDSQAK